MQNNLEIKRTIFHEKKGINNESWKCYLLISPQIIGLFVFSLYPILWAARYSFFYYDGVSVNTRFTGVENYITLFAKDITYWKTWITTLKFALLKLPVELFIAMLLALLISKKTIKFSGFFRSVYFLPHIISVAIVTLIFCNLFEPFGYINTLLIKLGIIRQPIEFLKSVSGGLMMIIVTDIWMNFGVNVLYFVAALQNISNDVYEAASLDGCGKVREFFSITLPLIAPVVQIICLLAIKGVLGTGVLVYLLTGGAPGGNTHTVNSYILGKFVPGFAQGIPNLGYGSAMCIITSVITAAISLIYLRLSQKASDLY